MTLEQFKPHFKYVKNNLQKQLGYDDAQDAFQEILIYLWNKPEITINYPKTYLNNLCNWYCFKKYKNKKDNIDLSKVQSITTNNIHFKCEITNWNLYEISDTIQKRLKHIPDTLMHPFSLKYIDNKSIKEISLELNLNENTVKTRIKRAKEYLKFKEFN